MHKIVLFIEPTDDAFSTPYKIGHLFMNRFTIDEEAKFEIVKVFELAKSSYKMMSSNHPEYSNFEEDRDQKGMGSININTVVSI